MTLKELIYDLYRAKTNKEAEKLIRSFISIPTHVYMLQVPYMSCGPGDCEPAEVVFIIGDENEAERQADKHITGWDKSNWIFNRVIIEKNWFLNGKCIGKLERIQLQ